MFARANRNRRGGSRTVKGLSEAGMVDLPWHVPSTSGENAVRQDLRARRLGYHFTALGDAIGRDADQPGARTRLRFVRDSAGAENRMRPRTERPRPRAKTNGGGCSAGGARGRGYLAVHSVEKSFGTRPGVRAAASASMFRPRRGRGFCWVPNGRRQDHGNFT